MREKQYPSEKQERFVVRLPDGMRDQIAGIAKKNSRSMNAEIIDRLQRSFAADGRETAIEEIKAVLLERDKVAFEESVNAALKRFKEELLDHQVQLPRSTPKNSKK